MSTADRSGNNQGGNQAKQSAKPAVASVASASVAAVEQESIEGVEGTVVLDTAQQSAMLARLDSLEKALAEERRKNEELLAAESVRKVSINDRPYEGECGYWFMVGPTKPEDYPGLKSERVKATDESEAKRWYCNSRAWPINSGTIIDPVSISISVSCVDPLRGSSILLQKRISVIRQKLERGQSLSKQEEEIMAKYEEKVHNF